MKNVPGEKAYEVFRSQCTICVHGETFTYLETRPQDRGIQAAVGDVWRCIRFDVPASHLLFSIVQVAV